jgi:hypothetical protein
MDPFRGKGRLSNVPVLRGLDVARRATVRVCDSKGKHRGQGLLLDLGGPGSFVLTCHHVIAPLTRKDLCVQTLQRDGQLSHPILAEYLPERSHPGQDAVVLFVPHVRQSEQPLLHELNLDAYAGDLPDPATGLNFFETRSFQAHVGPSAPLEAPARASGVWPNPPRQAYTVKGVHALVDPTDAREGISGSVVVYDGGVLGLAHFSRPGGEDFKPEVYLVPLRVWAEGWEELAERIEPLIDPRLRAAATVRRAKRIEPHVDIVIAKQGFRADLYVETKAVALARTTLATCGSAVIVGRPKSGKTRLAWRLMQEHPDALVVIPLTIGPPIAFEASVFVGQTVILFMDDLQSTAVKGDPAAWRRRMHEAARQSPLMILAARSGEEWRYAQEQPQVANLLRMLPHESFVYTSKVGALGADLTREQGFSLAQQLGLDVDAFEQRFDGTVGSLTLDFDEMINRYRMLKQRDRLGLHLNTLLDAAKLLHSGGSPRLTDANLRAASSEIIVGASIGHQQWRMLREATFDQGFGTFNEFETFQIYRPYLESCVEYTPTQREVEALAPVLKGTGDYDGLHFLGTRLLIIYKSKQASEILNDAQKFCPAPYGSLAFFARIVGDKLYSASVEEELQTAIKKGDFTAYRGLGDYLWKFPERHADAEHAYREALARGQGVHREYGRLLANIPGRENEAEDFFKIAMADSNGTQFGRALCAIDYARFLQKAKGRELEAERLMRQAQDAMPAKTAREMRLQRSIADLMAKQPGRAEDAERSYRAAIADGDEEALLGLANLLAFGKQARQTDALQIFQDAIAAGVRVASVGLARLLAELPGRELEAESAGKAAVAAGFEDLGSFFVGFALARVPGREADAEAAFRYAIDKGLGAAAYSLAMLLERQDGRSAEAEQAYRHAISEGENEAYIRLGELLAREPGREQDAERVYRDATAKEIGAAYLPLAKLLWFREGDEKEAEHLLLKAVDFGDDSAFFFLGLLIMPQEGRVEEAERALEECIKQCTKPRLVAEAHRLRANLLHLSARPQEAEDAYRNAIRMGAVDANLELGQLLIEQPGREHEAHTALETAAAAGVEGAAAYLRGIRRQRQRRRGRPREPR